MLSPMTATVKVCRVAPGCAMGGLAAAGVSGGVFGLERGYSLMMGFYKREREDVFEHDGFYDTRDRGFFHNGFLYFAGRDVGLIKTAGNNVAAAEVEAALKSLPGVANAFVVGIDDQAVGQIVGAAVVPAGPQELDTDAIITRLRVELSSYKVPRVLRVLAAADIPFMSNGKLDFRALAAKIADAPGAV